MDSQLLNNKLAAAVYQTQNSSIFTSVSTSTLSNVGGSFIFNQQSSFAGLSHSLYDDYQYENQESSPSCRGILSRKLTQQGEELFNRNAVSQPIDQYNEDSYLLPSILEQCADSVQEQPDFIEQTAQYDHVNFLEEPCDNFVENSSPLRNLRQQFTSTQSIGGAQQTFLQALTQEAQLISDYPLTAFANDSISQPIETLALMEDSHSEIIIPPYKIGGKIQVTNQSESDCPIEQYLAGNLRRIEESDEEPCCPGGGGHYCSTDGSVLEHILKCGPESTEDMHMDSSFSPRLFNPVGLEQNQEIVINENSYSIMEEEDHHFGTHTLNDHESSYTYLHDAGGIKSSRKVPRHRNEISKCTHGASQYYANGMCKNCYHAKGRTKKPSECVHHDRPLYAKGVCKNCYLSIYHKDKRLEKKKIKLQKKAEALRLKALQAKSKQTRRGRPCRKQTEAAIENVTQQNQ